MNDSFVCPCLMLPVSALAIAVPQEAFSYETAAAAISADTNSSLETSEFSESFVRHILKEFADILDTHYG